jgi:hypothetical protein
MWRRSVAGTVPVVPIRDREAGPRRLRGLGSHDGSLCWGIDAAAREIFR